MNINNREGFPSFKLGGRTLVSVEGLREWVKAQAASGKEAGAWKEAGPV